MVDATKLPRQPSGTPGVQHVKQIFENSVYCDIHKLADAYNLWRPHTNRLMRVCAACFNAEAGEPKAAEPQVKTSSDVLSCTFCDKDAEDLCFTCRRPFCAAHAHNNVCPDCALFAEGEDAAGEE